MHVLVVLTYGVSFKEWRDNGLLDREMKLYEKLSKERGVHFLHSPASTNQLIYKIQMRLTFQAGNNTTWINRCTDISNDPRTTGISNITLLEIAG